MAAWLARDTWGDPGCDRPKERARAACAAPGTTSELRDGVPERDVPLKAECTGLLLPLLLPPACRPRTEAMADWAGESLGLMPGVEQLGRTGAEGPGAAEGGPEGV